MLFFKKFHSIGNSNYYFHDQDVKESPILATETKVTAKFLGIDFKIRESFKTLEVSVPMLSLFWEVSHLSTTKVDEEYKDMTTYEKLNFNHLNKQLHKFYTAEENITLNEFRNKYDTLLERLDNDESLDDDQKEVIRRDLAVQYSELSKEIERSKLVGNKIILDKPTKHDNKIVFQLMLSGLEHLYTERLSGTVKHTYLCSVDEFGTILIYRVILVNEKMKAIDTFVLNKEIVDRFLERIGE